MPRRRPKDSDTLVSVPITSRAELDTFFPLWRLVERAKSGPTAEQLTLRAERHRRDLSQPRELWRRRPSVTAERSMGTSRSEGESS